MIPTLGAALCVMERKLSGALTPLGGDDSRGGKSWIGLVWLVGYTMIVPYRGDIEEVGAGRKIQQDKGAFLSIDSAGRVGSTMGHVSIARISSFCGASVLQR